MDDYQGVSYSVTTTIGLLVSANKSLFPCLFYRGRDKTGAFSLLGSYVSKLDNLFLVSHFFKKRFRNNAFWICRNVEHTVGFLTHIPIWGTQ